MKNIRKIILMALFITISYVGSIIKLPGPLSTIAIDSFAGYLGGLVIGSVYGGIIGMIAHLFVSMTSGFPLSFPVHLIISIMMFLSIFTYSFLAKKYNIVIGSFVGTLMNGVLMPLALMVLPFMDKGFLISLIPILIVASLLNIILSNAIYASIKNIIPIWVNE